MPRAGLDQKKITHAAIELANEAGLEQLTIAALAKKLGVRPPSLYNHVGSLTEIRTNIAREGIQKLEEILLTSVAGKSGEEAILEFSKHYLSFANENPSLYEATIQPMKISDPIVEKASKKMVDLLVQLFSTFPLKEEESLHLIRGLRSIVHGFASLQNAGGFQMNFKVEDSLLYTVKRLCQGLTNE